jgi:hypothetical protein
VFAHPRALHVELEELLCGLTTHLVAPHEDADALLAIVERDRGLAELLNIADERVLEAVREERVGVHVRQEVSLLGEVHAPDFYLRGA